jgi:mono/diheme cytochrome c family protein/glucose/arabinose dehydrogenase
MLGLAAISALLVGAAAPPGTPEGFEVAPGYRLELVAREPLVVAPVSLAFDADGRLLVAEMRTYMNDVAGVAERSPRNRVAMLHDDDGDGAFDRRTEFLSGLTLPRGATPYRSGVLVIEPPWLLYAVDEDGDGRADSVRRLIDGFGGLESPEHAGNGPIVGLDGWLEFSQHPVRVRFDGSNVETMPVSPHGQWGLTMDDVGRLYHTPNSAPVLIDAIPKWLAPKQPHASLASIGKAIAEDTTVHPSHPTPGVNRGYQERVLRGDGTLASFTAACGPAIVRTGAMGDALSGAIVICEPAGNLISAFTLDVAADSTDGVPVARHLFPGGELLRSTDERFRPVACAIGPDGAIYVADIARGVIQHKVFLTDYLKGEIATRGLEGPIGEGRVWRLVPEGWTQPAPPRLSAASNAELVRALRRENGWWRDTAQRLLVERQARDVEPDLVALVHDAQASEPSRIHALRTLAALGAALPALGDSAPPALCAHHTSLLGSADLGTLERRLLSAAPAVRHAAMIATASLALEGARVAALSANPDDRVLLDAFVATTPLSTLRGLASTIPDPAFKAAATATIAASETAAARARRPVAAAIPKDLLERGRAVFATCATCHGPEALGVAGTAPSLVGSDVVKGPPERLVRAILHGVDGGVMPDGRRWPAMTPLSMGDDDLAAVIAYVRATFGDCDTSIDRAGVAEERARWAGRARPWTVEELRDANR